MVESAACFAAIKNMCMTKKIILQFHRIAEAEFTFMSLWVFFFNFFFIFGKEIGNLEWPTHWTDFINLKNEGQWKRWQCFRGNLISSRTIILVLLDDDKNTSKFNLGRYQSCFQRETMLKGHFWSEHCVISVEKVNSPCSVYLLDFLYSCRT